jgi:hypothetical protein
MYTPPSCDELPTLRLEIKTLRMDNACFEEVAGDSDDNRMQGFKSRAANGELEFAKNLTYSAKATMQAFMERDMREQVAWLPQSQNSWVRQLGRPTQRGADHVYATRRNVVAGSPTARSGMGLSAGRGE